MIKVKNLNFTYPGTSSPTLQNLNFSIGSGEVFGFLGPSGAGKSTTQKILIGILKNFTGEVHVPDRDMRKGYGDFYEHIGVQFEFPNLYSKFTALENLNFFSNLYTEKTVAAAELLALVGLENDANTRISDFSKGMKMRLNFCRALLNDPQILFLDEPTSGLDPVNLRRILEIIKNLRARGKTVCITTHDMHVADSLCDRVAFLVDGKIALTDSPRELKISHGKNHLRVEFHENGRLVQRDFSLQNLAENTDFQQILREQKIETMHTQEATLEDIFIKTTGRRLV